MSARVFPKINLGELTSNGTGNAFDWLVDAADHIDDRLGRGYAAGHPALIGDFMKAAALSYHAERTVDAAEMIARALIELAKERGAHG